MKKDLTHIVCILDKSGSMQDKEQEVIAGFNNFVKEQKKVPGEARLSLVLFDTKINKPYSSMDIREVKELTQRDYQADGFTALLDAMGICIDEKGRELYHLKEEERPEHVIFVITTDGLENASLKYNKARIKEMISHQQDVYKWTFIFLGANQDAFAEANGLGINPVYTNNYHDYKRASYCYTNAVTCLRSGDVKGAKSFIGSASN